MEIWSVRKQIRSNDDLCEGVKSHRKRFDKVGRVSIEDQHLRPTLPLEIQLQKTMMTKEGPCVWPDPPRAPRRRRKANDVETDAAVPTWIPYKKPKTVKLEPSANTSV